MHGRLWSMVLVGWLSFACVGCTLSVNPLVSDRPGEAVFDPELLGDWLVLDRKQPTMDDSQVNYRITRDASHANAYVFTNLMKRSVPPSDNVRLTMLDGEMFLDCPLQGESNGPPPHLVVKLCKSGDRMVMYMLDFPSATGTPAVLRGLAHERTGELIVITASTDDFRDFLRKNAKNNAIWDKLTVIYQRIHPSPPKPLP